MVILKETKTIGEVKTFITKYESLNDLEHDIFSKEINVVFKGGRLSSVEGTKSFTGTKDLKEALTLLKEGWQSGAEKLTKDLKIANLSNSTNMVQKQVYDIVGYQASVPRYLQGLPTSMINKRQVKQKAKIITLIKSCVYPSTVSTNEIMQDSIRTIQIIQTLEQQGYRVNLYSAFHSIRDSEAIFVQVKLKSAGERINIAKLAFALAHPSFLRRILFRFIETEENIKNYGWTNGYGRVAEPHQTTELLEKNTYFIKARISDSELKSMFNIDEDIKFKKMK